MCPHPLPSPLRRGEGTWRPYFDAPLAVSSAGLSDCFNWQIQMWKGTVDLMNQRIGKVNIFYLGVPVRLGQKIQMRARSCSTGGR